MEYRQLGKTHLKVSVIGVGTEHLKKLSPEDVTQIITLALEEGVNYFDLVWTLPNILEGFQQSLQHSNVKAHVAFHLGSCINNGKYKRSRNPAECEKYLRTLLDQLNMDSAPVLNIHYVNDLKEWKEVNRKGNSRFSPKTQRATNRQSTLHKHPRPRSDKNRRKNRHHRKRHAPSQYGKPRIRGTGRGIKTLQRDRDRCRSDETFRLRRTAQSRKKSKPCKLQNRLESDATRRT